MEANGALNNSKNLTASFLQDSKRLSQFKIALSSSFKVLTDLLKEEEKTMESYSKRNEKVWLNSKDIEAKHTMHPHRWKFTNNKRNSESHQIYK